MRTGSGLRGRGNCELVATGIHPPPGPVRPGTAPVCSRSGTHRATAGGPMLVPRLLLRGLGRLLLLLLERTHLGEGLRPGDVGDRAARALLPVVTEIGRAHV